MADTLPNLPGKSRVHKSSLPLTSTRSVFVKKPPQAPLQQQGQDTQVRLRSSSSFHDGELVEELEQQGSHIEGVVMENTYRVSPDPQKKFSPGRLFINPIQ